MKKVIYEDLYEMNFLSGLSVSPDGKNLVFLKHKADKDKNGYKSYIYSLNIPTGNIKQLTFMGEEKNPKWIDDETIMFTSKRGNKHSKKDETHFFTLSTNGGEGKPKFTIPEKISKYEKLEDGKFACIAVKHCEGKEEKAEDEAQDGRDLLVFDEIYFWSNGEGIRNKIRDTLVIYDEKTGKLKQVSKKYTQVSGFSVSPDKQKIIFTGHTYENVYKPQGGVYIYDVSTGKTKTIVKEGKFHVGDATFMGNDKAFFTIGTHDFNGQNSEFAVLDVKTGEYNILPFADFPIGGSVGTDANFGSGRNKKFYDGKLYVTRPYRSRTYITSLDENGNYEDVCTKEGSIHAMDIAGGKIYTVALRGGHLCEIYSFDIETKEEKKLSSFNDEYHETHSTSEHEYFTFKNRDGIELEGFVLKPVGYKAGKKYPGILEMHGGPKVIFGAVFHHEMQVLANKGYFVFYTNPRGSDGRGSDFANMTGNLGGIDYNDFMDFTDEVIKRYPDLDENRIGICGGSYGGFMCNWMIGHTNRFKAAASQRSISNYLTKSLTTDIGYYHNMQQLKGTPWTNFENVWDTSPLKNAPLAKTPTLFIQSDEDYRCWMSDALQMFTALKMNGVDTKIALFHGEHHGLSRVGRPENRIGRLTEICNWFDKYLK